MRPAVSVGRTTALDGLDPNGFGHLSDLGSNIIHQHDYSSYFDAPNPPQSDRDFLENGILPIADSFDLNFDHLVGYNDGVIDDFNLDEYLHNDEQLAPEIQSTDPLAEKTANLQPQFGASSDGCDDGANAVSV